MFSRDYADYVCFLLAPLRNGISSYAKKPFFDRLVLSKQVGEK